MSEKIYLSRFRDGKLEPCEIWTAEQALRASLNHKECDVVCEIMEIIKNESSWNKSTSIIWSFDKNVWKNPRYLYYEDPVSLDKIVRYLDILGYRMVFKGGDDSGLRVYKISWWLKED